MRTLFKNAHVLSGSDTHPCMIIEDDHIIHVGEELDAPDACQVIDLAGRRVLPGFIDGYCLPTASTMNAKKQRLTVAGTCTCLCSAPH